MKKIFVLMLVLFVAFSMFAVDEGVAGASKYKVSFGNGLSYNNKDGIDKVDNTFKFQVVAPVSKVVQFGVEGSFNDVLDAGSTHAVKTWSALNNYGKVAVGIVVNEKINVGFYVMGGSENMSAVLDGNSEALRGNGFVEASAKLMLKSALFNNKLSKFDIKQGFKLGFLGHGHNLVGGVYKLPGEDDATATAKAYSGGKDAKAVINYSTWKYFGEFAVEVPVHTLAGWTNISNFTYGATLAYNVNGFNYTTKSDVFSADPTKIAGEVSLENWLKIAPDSSTEFKLTVKPGVSLAQTKWTIAGADVPESSSTYTKVYTDFGLWGKKSIEVANIMGIVPYFELGSKWSLAYEGTINSNVSSVGAYEPTFTFNSGSFAVDPGVKLGLKFGNWETSITWNPSATYSLGSDYSYKDANANNAYDAGEMYHSNAIANATAASASNIWNLANWNFSVACEFPPPTK